MRRISGIFWNVSMALSRGIVEVENGSEFQGRCQVQFTLTQFASSHEIVKKTPHDVLVASQAVVPSVAKIVVTLTRESAFVEQALVAAASDHPMAS
mmetsp:Transcript_17299/g.40151  ORF Transcript_17299/g.40151 Transcript_17299/m.40151 type:complete len:96 (+) Transcript_17299:2382-2669(+)